MAYSPKIETPTASTVGVFSVLAILANAEVQLFNIDQQLFTLLTAKTFKKKRYVDIQRVPAMRAGIPLDFQKVVDPLDIRKTDLSREAAYVPAVEIMRLQGREVAPQQPC